MGFGLQAGLRNEMWRSSRRSPKLESASSPVERDVGLRVRRADVLGARADQPVVRVLLQDVRRPAGHAAHGKHRREQLRRNAERVIRGRRNRSPRSPTASSRPSPGLQSAAKSGTTSGCRPSAPAPATSSSRCVARGSSVLVDAVAEARNFSLRASLARIVSSTF